MEYEEELEKLRNTVLDERQKNFNLKRVCRERANADRKLENKKTHTGYVVLSCNQIDITYKDGNGRSAMDQVWETRIQTPYDVEFDLKEAISMIKEEIGSNIGMELGIQKSAVETPYWKIKKWLREKEDEEIEKLLEENDITEEQAREYIALPNVLFEIRPRANYVQGYWEVAIKHTEYIYAPKEMRKNDR